MLSYLTLFCQILGLLNFFNASDVFVKCNSASDFNAALQHVLQRQESLLVSVILITSGGFNLWKLVKLILTSGFLSLNSLKASFIVKIIKCLTTIFFSPLPITFIRSLL